MSNIRRLPSGKWQATVRGRDGRKHTKSHRLQVVVTDWAKQMEGRPAAQRRDPRAGDVKVAEWRAWYAAAHAGKASAPRNASLWSVHCKPQWGTWKLSAVTRMEAQAWVTALGQTASQRDEDEVLSASTVTAIVRVMSSMYRAAVLDDIVSVNPFASLSRPPVEPQPVFFYEPDAAAAGYAAMGELDPRWRVMVELGMTVGLRFEELAGPHGHRVDWLRGRLEVVDVMTGGGPVSYANFRNRVWYPAVAAARLCGRPAGDTGSCSPGSCGDPAHRIRAFPPRVMRHTAASWLVQDGVPLYDVQALLGHESFATTQRYAHLAPDAHSKVLASWERRAAAGATR